MIKYYIESDSSILGAKAVCFGRSEDPFVERIFPGFLRAAQQMGKISGGSLRRTLKGAVDTSVGGTRS
jgi:hypothetical protein